MQPTAATPHAPDKTFDVVKSVLSDVGDMFSDDLLHLGGDEVNTRCWLESGAIRQWLLDNDNMTAAGESQRSEQCFSHPPTQLATHPCIGPRD